MIAADQTLSLLDPWFLVGLGLLVLLLGVRLWRRRAALPTANVAVFAGLPRSVRSRLTWLPLVLHGLGAVALVVALARPVNRDVIPMRDKGVDIVLVLDTSSSMTEADMAKGRVTRMKVAREKALEFTKGRTSDRLGLVTFALFPELRCPLTLDQDALAVFLKDVRAHRPGEPGDGTWIGAALGKAVELLRDEKAKSKVVVLLSDGESMQEEISTADAAKLAKDADVRVHTIGLGRNRRVNPFTGERVYYSTDFTALREISKTTGGEFFQAETAAALAEVYKKIDKMEKVELQDPRYRTVEQFLWPMGIGGVLFLLALLLELLWIRTLP